jgi:hypothetical protein
MLSYINLKRWLCVVSGLALIILFLGTLMSTTNKTSFWSWVIKIPFPYRHWGARQIVAWARLGQVQNLNSMLNGFFIISLRLLTPLKETVTQELNWHIQFIKTCTALFSEMTRSYMEWQQLDMTIKPQPLRGVSCCHWKHVVHSRFRHN